MFAGFLIDVRRAEDAVSMDVRGQGDRAGYARARSFGLGDDILDRLVEQPMVKRL
jgi:hypothetical protein